MIESFDTIEVWDKKTLIDIPRDLSRSVTEIVTTDLNERKIDYKTKKTDGYREYIGLLTAFRQHAKYPKRDCFIKFNIEFTNLFVKEYQRQNKHIRAGRKTVINPEVIESERKKRDIIAKDFQLEYSEYKITDVMNYFLGKSRPRLNFLIDLTEYIQNIEKDILELPPSKGVRWDLDEWIRTSNIPIKHSWEQEND